MTDNLVEYFERQIAWSRETFGPALRTKGVIDHIRKELNEIEQNPHDLSEWVDVVILAMDGFWRHGGKASDILLALVAKQEKNMARAWPDWRIMSEDSAIEHDRTRDISPPPESHLVGEVWRDGLGRVTPKPAHADAVLEDMGFTPAPASHVRATDSFGNDLVERELVSIVLRMSRHLQAVETPAAKKLNAGALDYLRRKGLMPSPLRGEDTVVQSAVEGSTDG